MLHVVLVSYPTFRPFRPGRTSRSRPGFRSRPTAACRLPGPLGQPPTPGSSGRPTTPPWSTPRESIAQVRPTVPMSRCILDGLIPFLSPPPPTHTHFDPHIPMPPRPPPTPPPPSSSRNLAMYTPRSIPAPTATSRIGMRHSGCHANPTPGVPLTPLTPIALAARARVCFPARCCLPAERNVRASGTATFGHDFWTIIIKYFSGSMRPHTCRGICCTECSGIDRCLLGTPHACLVLPLTI